MPKKIEENKKTYTLKSIFFNIENLDLLACLIIVCGLLIPTLIRPWLIYDERAIADGSYFPIPRTFGEIFEILESFGLNFNIGSSNTIYTSNYVTRTCPLGQIYGMVVGFFLHKDSFLFHVFNLVLHLINTCLIYLILKFLFTKEKPEPHTLNLSTRYLLIILTSIWAVHPVMMEGVLLTLNSGASFSYMFFFGFLLDFLINREKNKSDLRLFTIPFIFLIPMLINEYIVTLPFVLFVISFCENYQNFLFRKAWKKSLDETKPYFFGLVLYLCFFFFFSQYRTSGSYLDKQFIVFLERVFWLSPQMFFHMLKLVFYPKVLSIDQTLFVQLGKTLIDPYSVFCILFLFCWLFIPLILFLRSKKFPSVFFLTWTFFFALLPFLHILMPSYTLACERYLYCPLALFIFGLANIFRKDMPQTFKLGISSLLTIVLILCLVRSHYRTLDWKDNYTFINSSYKTSTNTLFKAMRLGMLGKAINILQPYREAESREYFIKALKLLKDAKVEAKKLRAKYQKSLPLVLKAYGLDYESILSKVAFLEASTICLELKQDYRFGLKILEPYMKKPERVEPRVLELYAYLLVLDKKNDKAKKILLKENSLYPHTSFILNNLIDFYTKYEVDLAQAEEYLKEALRFYPYDPQFLLKAINFYEGQKNNALLAKYSYLYGLRTQSKLAYQQALSTSLSAKNLRLARRIVNKILGLDPNDPESLYFVSNYYYSTKEYKKALSSLINAYSIAIKMGSDSKLIFDIGNTLARLYLLLGDNNKAKLITQDISSLAENNVDDLVKLAKLYKSLGLNEELSYSIEKIKLLELKGAKRG